jgi:aminoglycoside/choline kinase family phosphotransferase/dTDP-glucose pyrophosphorylase
VIKIDYKKEDIVSWIVLRSRFSKKMLFFPEDPILGTGGALKNAESFLKDKAFLVHNADIMSDIDLRQLLDFHYSSGNLATLAVHDHEILNNVLIDKEGLFQGIEQSGHRQEGMPRCAFTGVAVYEPGFLEFLPDGESCVVDAWRKAVSAGRRIGTCDVRGCLWSDIGTPSSYAAAVFHALRLNGETVYIDRSVQNCGDVRMNGTVVMEEGSRPDNDTSLRNCIMLPGGRAESGIQYTNCILGPGFVLEIEGPGIPGISGEEVPVLIGTGGSDRQYFRSRKEKKPVVIMQCADGDTDFERHMEYSRFFLDHDIPVPALLESDTERKRAVFEDLGDLSLYSWLKCRRMPEQVENMYRRVLDILVKLHTDVTGAVSGCPLLENRFFDYDHFRWETGYFLERFVRGVKNNTIYDMSALNDEFHLLALKSDAFSRTIIHRDFQTQNIMVTQNTIPRCIDYQGAKMGPPGYDVVSILWDPYYRLEDNLRDLLLDYYISEIKGRTQGLFSEEEFRKSLPCCRLQRHMQALGAYGFLSLVKGKQYFLKYVPEALRLLKKDASLTKAEYPVLNELVISL